MSEKVSVMDLDWDVLILLDACRFDSFEKINKIKGKLKPIYSPASTSGEWLKKAFTKKYDNLIYISSCPIGIRHVKRFGLCEVVDVLTEGFDDDVQTVFPEKVNEGFLNLAYD